LNWLQYLIRALSLVPYVVSGIEQIHGEAKSGTAKKQLAMDALGLSSTVAKQMSPEHAEAADAAAQLVSTAIDGTVAVMNAARGLQTPSPLAPQRDPAFLTPAPVVTVPVPEGDNNLEVKELSK
jgi:hypothetical protein